jgi:DNA-binding beta-propeller fold protein YncE
LPVFANPVHGVAISNDGLVYVADRTNMRVQVFSVDGKYVNQLFINRSLGQPSAARVNFSPDPEQTYMYVADYGNSRVIVVNRKTLEILYQFGKRGAAPGDFQGLHHMAADSKGNLYTAEVAPGNRMQRFLFRGIATPPATTAALTFQGPAPALAAR